MFTVEDYEWALWFCSMEQMGYRLRNRIRVSDEDWARYDSIVAQATHNYLENVNNDQ